MKVANQKHPTLKKLEKLFDLMRELDIELSIDPYGVTTVIDTENNQELEIVYKDGMGNVTELPPPLEYFLVKDK